MMMSVGHCTQRKLHFAAILVWLFRFVPKLLAHQIYLLLEMVDAITAT